MKFGYIILSALLFLTACRKSAPPSGRQTFIVRGVVKELPGDGKTVVIQHEAISNYMAAMTMPFEAHDPKELEGLVPGEAITFHLVVTATDGWVEQIVPREASAAPSTNAAPGILITRAVEPLDEGELLPDYHFTNELGQAVTLSQYKGEVIALTFFFTSCPFPNFCPRLTHNFSEVAAQLAALSNAPPRWRLLSITFDPRHDTPERLLAYARNAEYNPAHWSFLTGALDQISELADNFGETYSFENGTINHNLRTVVVDAHGRIKKILPGNYWSPADLIHEMTTAAR